MDLLGNEVDFGPDVYSPSASGGKHETVEPLDFLNVLVLFVDLFGVN
jgi:hypothetical protein